MPTVLNVPNAGDLSVAPVVRLQPTGQRSTRTANATSSKVASARGLLDGVVRSP